jgi:hypothetical protein
MVDCKDCEFNTKDNKCSFMEKSPDVIKGKCCINDVYLKGYGWVNPEVEGIDRWVLKRNGLII